LQSCFARVYCAHRTSRVCARAAAEGDLRTPTETDEEVRRLYQQSERHISLLAANLFHDRFIDRCLKLLPEELHLTYGGDLGLYSRPPKVTVKGSAQSNALIWSVDGKSFGVFRFWLSTERVSLTAGKVMIDGQPLFINIDFVDENRGVDAKLSQLGNRSVREVLKLLEDEPEKKTDRKDSKAVPRTPAEK
jgi:hypothetical protein